MRTELLLQVPGKREQVGAHNPDRQVYGMYLGYGGTPYGPADTGKTESVKALGACLSRQVLVFNCNEGFDFQAMDRIFISTCSVWCVGVFRRVQPALGKQMSAISQSVQLIHLRSRPTQDYLLAWPGDHCEPQCGYLHYRELQLRTGYGGRQKLPVNLKPAIQACGDEHTQQRAGRRGNDVCRGFQELPNEERIQFGTNANLIFETDNLRFASPATISRLSAIFLSEEDVDVKPMIASSIAQQPPECQGSLAT